MWWCFGFVRFGGFFCFLILTSLMKRMLVLKILVSTPVLSVNALPLDTCSYFYWQKQYEFCTDLEFCSFLLLSSMRSSGKPHWGIFFHVLPSFFYFWHHLVNWILVNCIATPVILTSYSQFFHSNIPILSALQCSCKQTGIFLFYWLLSMPLRMFSKEGKPDMNLIN